MDSETLEKIEEAVCHVIAVFSFMFGERVGPESEPLECPEDGVHACVTFSGALEGRLHVLTSKALAGAMAMNALGLDEAGEHESLDALRELTNQLCGEIVLLMAGSEAKVTLGIPDSALLDPADWVACAAAEDSITLRVDEAEPLLVRCELQL